MTASLGAIYLCGLKVNSEDGACTAWATDARGTCATTELTSLAQLNGALHVRVHALAGGDVGHGWRANLDGAPTVGA